MDGAAFKIVVGKLGHTQSSLARELGVPLRTIQNWARNGPPDHMGLILSSWVRLAIKPPEPNVWAKGSAAKEDAAVALDSSLQSILDRAARAGWPRELVAAGTISWFLDRVLTKRS